MIQSVEPNIADLANGWLKSHKLNYKLEQESLNAEIDKALADYFTKNGGTGANRPDAKLLLQDKEFLNNLKEQSKKNNKNKEVNIKPSDATKVVIKNRPELTSKVARAVTLFAAAMLLCAGQAAAEGSWSSSISARFPTSSCRDSRRRSIPSASASSRARRRT